MVVLQLHLLVELSELGMLPLLDPIFCAGREGDIGGEGRRE